jgi:hypothetical protein
LFSQLSTTTDNPIFKKRYRRMREDADKAVTTLEQLIHTLGGDPKGTNYARPVMEAFNTQLVQAFRHERPAEEAEVDHLTLLAAMQAWSIAQGHLVMLAKLVEEMQQGPQRLAIAQAVGLMMSPAGEHVLWCQQASVALFSTMVQHPLVERAATKAQELTGRLTDKRRETPE